MQVQEVGRFKQNFGANHENSFSSETIKHLSERRLHCHCQSHAVERAIEASVVYFQCPSLRTRIPTNVRTMTRKISHGQPECKRRFPLELKLRGQFQILEFQPPDPANLQIRRLRHKFRTDPTVRRPRTTPLTFRSNMTMARPWEAFQRKESYTT